MPELFTALITPYVNQQIDLESLRRLIDFQIESGVNGLVVLGTTAEAELLNKDEKVTILKEVSSYVNKRVKLILGAGSSSTKEMVEFSKIGQKHGYEEIMVVTPFYVRPSQKGVIQHFGILNEEKIPFIVYNHPLRTGCHLSLSTIEMLLNFSYCKGLKDATGSMDTMLKFGTNFKIYSGDDLLLIPHLSLGASGIISVASNLIPNQFKSILDTYSKAPREALLQFKQLQPLIEAISLEPNPIGIKAALSLSGYINDEIRLPYIKASNETKEVIEKCYFDFLPN